MAKKSTDSGQAQADLTLARKAAILVRGFVAIGREADVVEFAEKVRRSPTIISQSLDPITLIEFGDLERDDFGIDTASRAHQQMAGFVPLRVTLITGAKIAIAVLNEKV